MTRLKSGEASENIKPTLFHKKLIKEFLEAAGWAPSAHNAQPWRFIVLADESVKRELAEAMAESWAADMAKDGLKIEARKIQG